MNYGLYGINGVYNFGCEAIVRGTFELIKRIDANNKVTYYSYNYEYDKKALSDIEIDIVEINRKNSFFIRIINKVLRKIRYEHRITTIDLNKLFTEDVIVSIGGDMYTIPSHVRRKEKYYYYNELIDILNKCIINGKKVIAFGASVGPWGQYKKAVSYYVSNLSKYSMIICREFDSIDYLKELNFNNVFFMPDPAFLVRKNKNDLVDEKNVIGINFSPLSFVEVYGEVNESSISKIANIIDTIILQLDCDLLFIPHVISKNINDNDYVFMKKVLEQVKNKSRIKIADTSNGYLGIKKQLRCCKMIVSSRMHCAINGICECVPTIFLSYSLKSVGMAKYIYGDDKWVVNLKDVEEKLINIMCEMNNERETIRAFLKKRTKEIENEFCDSTDVFSILRKDTND